VAVQIPGYSLDGTSTADITVSATVGLFDQQIGIELPSRQCSTSSQKITCTDDWIQCEPLRVLQICVGVAIVAAMVCIVTSCCKCHRIFGLGAFVLTISVLLVIVSSSYITSHVAENLESEADAFEFMCAVRGEASVDCMYNAVTECINNVGDNETVVDPLGFKVEVTDGVYVFLHYVFLAVAFTSLLMLLSIVIFFINYFFQCLCCCRFCPCCRRREERNEHAYYPMEGQNQLTYVV